jgi:cell division protein FtsL
MRLMMLGWIVGIAVLVAALFHLKYQVEGLDQRLALIERGIDRDREAIRVLKAEWAYLNRPERLERLARSYLQLRPASPYDVRTLSDLPKRFPSPYRVKRTAKAEVPR